MVFREDFGAFNEDSNHDSKNDKEKLISRTGIEPSIIPAWKEIIIKWKYLHGILNFKFN